MVLAIDMGGGTTRLGVSEQAGLRVCDLALGGATNVNQWIWRAGLFERGLTMPRRFQGCPRLRAAQGGGRPRRDFHPASRRGLSVILPTMCRRGLARALSCRPCRGT